MASNGFERRERKEAVVTGVAEVEDEEKDSCSHRDASVSGVGELRNMSNSGVHGSMLVRLFVPARLAMGKRAGISSG